MNLSRSAPLIDSFPSFQHLNNITNFPKALADAGRHWGVPTANSKRLTATANRLMVAPNERSFQVDLVRLDRNIPTAGCVASRDPCPSTSTHRAAAQSRAKERCQTLSPTTKVPRRCEAAGPKSAAVISRVRFVRFEAPLRIWFKAQRPAFPHETLVQSHIFSFNGATAYASFGIESIGSHVLATYRALANQCCQMVACLYSAGPKSPFIIDAHLILFWSVNAIQPKFSAVQCESVAVLYNQIEGPTWDNQQQKNNRDACAHGSRTIAWRDDQLQSPFRRF